MALSLSLSTEEAQQVVVVGDDDDDNDDDSGIFTVVECEMLTRHSRRVRARI